MDTLEFWDKRNPIFHEISFRVRHTHSRIPGALYIPKTQPHLWIKKKPTSNPQIPKVFTGILPPGNIPEGKNSHLLGSGHDEHEEGQEIVHGQPEFLLQQPRHRALQLLVGFPQDFQLLPGIHCGAVGIAEPWGSGIKD